MTNFPIIDLHNDIASNVLEATGKDISKRNTLKSGTPQVAGVVSNNNVDIPRMKEGGVRLVFTSLFGLDKKSYDELLSINQSDYNFSYLSQIKFGFPAILEQLSYYYEVCEKFNSEIILIKSRREYGKLAASGKIGFILHMEGADYIDKDLNLLSVLHELGVRSIGLTWRNRNKFAGGTNVSDGLTTLGKKIVKKVKSMGMVLDLAHANEKTFWDIIKITNHPIVVSHTLCRSLCDNSRNLSDEQIKAVASLGGVIGLAAIPSYIGGDRIADYLKHFEHIIDLVGDERVCFGTDFDGLVGPEDTFINSFTGSNQYPNVTNSMRKRGFSEKTIERICYLNTERIIKETLI